MGFVAKQGGNYKPVPPGAYVARCYQVIDLGTQVSDGQFGVQSVHKVRLVWELFGEDDDGQPLTVSFNGQTMPMTVNKNYTVSLHEKSSLRKDLAAWRGRDFTSEEQRAFDVSTILGVYALINVTNTSKGDKVYANVAGLSPLPKALQATKPAGVHELMRFDLDEPDMQVFDTLPPYLQEQIKKAPEFNRSSSRQQPALAGDIDDDVPF